MKNLNRVTRILAISLFLVSCASNKKNIDQYGSLHEAIGKKHSQERVNLVTLIKKNNYFGIGAIENLKGEITVVDGRAIITKIASNGKLKPMTGNTKATMFVGAQVKQWQQLESPKSMKKMEFEQWIVKEAALIGLSTNQAFMFKVKGTFSNVRMHVINGACPLHARMNKIAIPKDKKAYEGNFSKINAVIVGVFAKNSVGKLTHPDTNIHPHIVFTDTKGIELTGHLEDFEINSGTTLFLPKP